MQARRAAQANARVNPYPTHGKFAPSRVYKEHHYGPWRPAFKLTPECVQLTVCFVGKIYTDGRAAPGVTGPSGLGGARRDAGRTGIGTQCV